MKALVYTLALVFLVSSQCFTQSLEDDVNVMFMKAKVLYDAERFDEAVRMYSQILSDNEDFAPAYLMRAKSKFELGAFKGTKQDIIEFITLHGVTKEVIKLMAQTEQQLGNQKAAMNYVTTAIELDPYDSELYLVKGYIHFIQKDKSEACELWSRSAKLGDRRAQALLEEHCAIIMEMKEMREKEKQTKRTEEREKEPEVEKEKETDDMVVDETEISEDVDKVPNEPKIQKPVLFEKPDLDAIQEVEIDEELSVVIGNGLGERKLDSNPDMFIVSDREGKVVINICVDEQGKVVDSSINKKLTTLFKTSLTSLALRKSKEFKFYPSFRDEQCGYLIYVIKTVE